MPGWAVDKHLSPLGSPPGHAPGSSALQLLTRAKGDGELPRGLGVRRRRGLARSLPGPLVSSQWRVGFPPFVWVILSQVTPLYGICYSHWTWKRVEAEQQGLIHWA